jgi:hypothetical protein
MVMAPPLDQDLYFNAPATSHFNVCYQGGAVQARATAPAFAGLDANIIEWVWVVEQKRYATREEILTLCKTSSRV